MTRPLTPSKLQSVLGLAEEIQNDEDGQLHATVMQSLEDELRMELTAISAGPINYHEFKKQHKPNPVIFTLKRTPRSGSYELNDNTKSIQNNPTTKMDPITTGQLLAKDGIFVINGFYMAMREKYTGPTSAIQYYVIEWESDRISWSNFRSKIIGSTDPINAEAGSLRNIIYRKYKQLGLAFEPNIADNGIHASASPFESLWERMNWLGMPPENDAFGSSLLWAGFSKLLLSDYTKDPQITYLDQKRSVFDLLEDLDSQKCLDQLCSLAGVVGGNHPILTSNVAFVFIKPHAMNDKVKNEVVNMFTLNGIRILQHGQIDGKTISSKQLIDNHYYSIAQKAVMLKPHQLNPSSSKLNEFQTKFGPSWQEALQENLIYNAMDACNLLGIDGFEMDRLWSKAKTHNKLLKFAGGFYCGHIHDDYNKPTSKIEQPSPPKAPSGSSPTPVRKSIITNSETNPVPTNATNPVNITRNETDNSIFVINGFYMTMREKYTNPNASIHWYVVEWDSRKLTWSKFRSQVIGATDPSVAEVDSLRSTIYKNYQKLGLKSEPNVADNGVHASASPFESLAERMNWLGVKPEDDNFGSALIWDGFSKKLLMDWTKDPQVKYQNKTASVFDRLEDLDTQKCLETACSIAGVIGGNHPQLVQNVAFVFIKPHAVNPLVMNEVEQKFNQHGIIIVKQGKMADGLSKGD